MLNHASARPTKSLGTTLKLVSSGLPGTGSSATRGWRSSNCNTQYGPSYFCVSPVLLSPTTTDGRYTVAGSPAAIAARTSRSASALLSS